MKLSNQVYDVLKWVTLVMLPAVGTAYLGLSQILNLPYATQVTGSIVVITTLLGTLIGISTVNHNKEEPTYDGVMLVNHSDPDKEVWSLDLGDELENLEVKDKIVLRVKTVDE